MVVGESDTGKTTLVTAIANALRARRQRVAVIDADLGQSEIGPPTTIGLGRIPRRLQRLAEAELIALHFVGVTSPAQNLVGVIVGTRRLLDRARAERFARVVIDTSGLIGGVVGRTLKHAKIEATDPDLLICLERAGECDPVVAAYAGGMRPEVMRLPAAPAARPRSAAARRRHRHERLQAYFGGARRVVLDPHRVPVRGPDGEALTAGSGRWVVEGALAGLLDRTRATLGLGIVRDVDDGTGMLHLDATIPAATIASVLLGRERYPT
jgi:polynucleotide 5'-hydroxyl-kinase GRC3/NOL9